MVVASKYHDCPGESTRPLRPAWLIQHHMDMKSQTRRMLVREGNRTWVVVSVGSLNPIVENKSQEALLIWNDCSAKTEGCLEVLLCIPMKFSVYLESTQSLKAGSICIGMRLWHTWNGFNLIPKPPCQCQHPAMSTVLFHVWIKPLKISLLSGGIFSSSWGHLVSF